MYSVDIIEVLIGLEFEFEYMININGGGLYNSGLEEIIVGNGNNYELYNGVLY